MEQIENIVSEFAKIQAKLPELRDLFWLKIDRYSEADQQRGAEFDEKFNRKLENLSRVIDGFTSFIQKSFEPSAEEVARERALEKLKSVPGIENIDENIKEVFVRMILAGKGKHIVGLKMRRPAEKLAVIFPDGTEISERKTTETLVKVIRKIGVQKVFDLQMKCDRELLVSQNSQVMKNPQFVEDGYYINSHSSTQTKKQQLEYISDRLNLGLKVEILEK